MSDAGFPSPSRDFCDETGAKALKAIIESYWRARGWAVEVKLVPGGWIAAMRSGRLDLRSDMVNGAPTRRIVEELKDAA